MASSPQIFAPNQNTLPKTIPAIETCKWYFFAVLTLTVFAWVSPPHLSDKSGAFSCTLHLFLRVFWWNVCCRAAVEVQLKYCHCCHLLHPARACIIQTGELHKAAKLYFTLLACFSAYILFFCVFFIRWHVLEPELHIITTFCAWAYYMHVCAPAVYIALATPVTTVDAFIRWSCQDVSSDAARGKKVSLHWIFLGVGLLSNVWICQATASITSRAHINNAKRRRKQWHSQRDAWQTFSGQQWTENNVDSLHHSQKRFWKKHTEMTSVAMGLPAAHMRLVKFRLELFLSESCNQTGSKNSSRIFSADFFMLQKQACCHSSCI